MAKKTSKLERARKLIEKHHTAFILATVGVLGTVLLLLSAGVTLKASFLLGDDLLLDLQPGQLSLQGHYGEQQNITFSLESTNPFYCTAACSYRFVDESRGTIIENASFSLEGDDRQTWSYVIGPSRAGRGQDVYRFEVTCENVQGGFCLTSSPQRQASSLVTLNYDLTEDEKLVKESVRERFLSFLGILADIDVRLRVLQERAGHVSQWMQVGAIMERTTALESSFGELRITAENLRRTWEAESYYQLDRRLNGSFREASRDLLMGVGSAASALDARVTEYGLAANESKRVQKLLFTLDDTRGALTARNATVLLGNISTMAARFNQSVELARVGNHTQAITQLGALEQDIITLQESASNESARFMVEGRVLAMYEKDYLCRLSGDSDCSTITMMRALSGDFYSIRQDGPAQDVQRSTCSALDEAIKSHAQLRNTTAAELAVMNVSLNLSQAFMEDADYLRKELRQESLKGLEIAIAVRSDTEFPRAAASVVQEVEFDLESRSVSHDEELLTLWLRNTTTPAEEINRFERGSCAVSAAHLDLSTPLEQVEPFEAPSFNSTIDATLSDNPPICCLFGECQPCCTEQSCRQDPASYPVIFLHGHSFNKANAPAYSVESFNELQQALEQEGYLHAGLVTPGSSGNIRPGEWGLSGRPVAVKATYYLDSFREEENYVIVPSKSESIDTYALRLRDIIAEVKERTGRPRVNIVAHSMGGLVARKYLQVFGGADVDTLIMIGTPNQGIVGSVNDFCPVFGERKECEDMQKGSLFLNKLNDPSRQSPGVEMHTITGLGCRMDGKQGDGVVLAENVMLDGAENHNITGSCGTLTNLHTEMLDVEKYPDVLRAITDILEE